MESTEIRLAFEWTCPTCGTDHFVRAIRIEANADAPADLLEEHGIDPEMPGGFFVRSPNTVLCPDCKTRFKTEDPE